MHNLRLKLACLDRAPSNRAMVWLAVSFIVMVLLEILAFSVGGLFSWLASRIWLLLVLTFFAISARSVVIEAADDIRNKNWLPIIAIVGIGIYVFWGIGRINRVFDYETAQQLVDGLNALKEPDLGYTGQAAFWGYPVRQYVILALPSFLFGKSMFTAHIVYDFVCLLGFAMLYVGAKRYLADKLPGFARFAGLFPLLVMCSPIIVTYITFHEQTILPPAYAMIAVGWFLILAARFSLESLLCLTASGMILGTMYTPGLTMAALVVFMLAWVVAHGIARYVNNEDNAGSGKKLLMSKTVVLLSMALCVGVSTLMSFMLISQGNSLRPSGVDIAFIVRILKMVLLEDPFGLFRILTPVMLIYCVLAFLGLFKKLDIILILWAAGSLMAALLMHGSNTGASEYIQRVMVIIPVVATLFGMRFYETSAKFVKKPDFSKAVCIGAFSIAAMIAIANIAFPTVARDPQYTPHKVASRTIAAESTVFAFEAVNSVKSNGFNEEQTSFLLFGVSAWDGHVRHLLEYLSPGLNVHIYYGNYESAEDIGVDINEGNIIVFAREGASIPPDIIEHLGAPETIMRKIRGGDLKFWRIIMDRNYFLQDMDGDPIYADDE